MFFFTIFSFYLLYFIFYFIKTLIKTDGSESKQKLIRFEFKLNSNSLNNAAANIPDSTMNENEEVLKIFFIYYKPIMF